MRDWYSSLLSNLETTIPILLCAEMKSRAYLAEVHVETLAASTIIAKTIALEIFKVYPPAMFVWKIRCEVMLSMGRPLAESRNVMPNFNR